MRMGGNEAHKVEGQGTAVLVSRPLVHLVLEEVLYVPTMVHNLFSRGQAMARGAKEEADEQGFVLRRPDDFKIILTGDTHGMSELHQTLQVISAEKKGFGNVSVVKPSVWGGAATHGSACAASGAVSLQLAHERLAHMLSLIHISEPTRPY